MMQPTHLIMFAKAPVPGRVKTRLAKHIGSEAATALYVAFLRDLTSTLLALAQANPQLACVLSVSGDTEHPLFLELEERGLTRVAQRGDGLGERLEHAVQWSRVEGAQSTILIGSDAPTLGVEFFAGALRAMETRDVVISPSSDGGYTMLGLKGAPGGLFRDVPWSTPEVFGTTLRRAAEDKRSIKVLPLTFDVDTLEDFFLLRAFLLDYPDEDTLQVALESTIAALRKIEV